MAQIEIPKPNTGSKPNTPGNVESSLIRSRSSLDTSANKDKDKKDESKTKLKGGIKKKDPTFGEKVKRSFVKEDLRDIRDYIIFEVVIPGVQQGLFNMVVGTAAQVFHMPMPRTSFNGYRSDRYGGPATRLTPHEREYRDYTSIQRGTSVVQKTQQRYDRFYATDYPFTYKEDADAVLEQMMDICDSCGWVSVMKFFEIADPEGTIADRNPYTNENFGWHSLGNATVQFNGDGYVITLPPARVK